MAVTTQPMTAEQLFAAPELGRCELVRGELIMMSPAGSQHGYVSTNLAAALAVLVKRHGLGVVLSGDPGFRIGSDPATVRAPDVAFVRAERAAAAMGRGFFPGAPDLAVEVISPSDRASEVSAKVQAWLGAGCGAVWVADPETQSVTVYRSRTQIVVLGVGDQLSGEDVVPGFSLPVAEVFAP